MNIDEIGEFLEHEGLSDDMIDEFFEHHGVVGMKWGIRRGKSKTGVSRSRGALIDRNDRLRRNIRQVQSGEKFKASAAIGRAFVGEKKQKENWKRLTKDLNDQNARLKAGKATIGDRINMLAIVAPANLLVTHRPAK